MVYVQNLSKEVFEHAAQNVAKFTTNGLSQEEIGTMRPALCSRRCGTSRREIVAIGRAPAGLVKPITQDPQPMPVP